VADDKGKDKPKGEPWWVVYIALLVAGVILLGEAYEVAQLQKWTARLGISLVYSAMALLVANGKFPGILAAVIVWVAALISFAI
jgi:hypothetical protein